MWMVLEALHIHGIGEIKRGDLTRIIARFDLVLTFHAPLDFTCLYDCLSLSAILHAITEKPNRSIIPWCPVGLKDVSP